METVILWKTVDFEFGPPAADSPAALPDFDGVRKDVFVSFGFAGLVPPEVLPYFAAKIVRNLRAKASETPLDFLQKFDVDGARCWCVDDGKTISLRLPRDSE